MPSGPFYQTSQTVHHKLMEYLIYLCVWVGGSKVNRNSQKVRPRPLGKSGGEGGNLPNVPIPLKTNSEDPNQTSLFANVPFL